MRSPFRAVLFGALAGAALFFAPFALGFVFFVLVLSFIFRGRRRYYYSRWDYRSEVISIDGRDGYYQRTNVPSRTINIH